MSALTHAGDMLALRDTFGPLSFIAAGLADVELGITGGLLVRLRADAPRPVATWLRAVGAEPVAYQPDRWVLHRNANGRPSVVIEIPAGDAGEEE